MGGRDQPGPGAESVILLDTHVLIWLRAGDRRLGPRTHREIDRALGENEVAVSAISFWELEMLRGMHRIEIYYEMGEWRRLLLREGLTEIPVDGEIAIRAGNLTDFQADPADRFIVATALAGHQLVTAYQQILDWPEPLSRLDATK